MTSKNLDIIWVQGKCDGDAYFLSNEEICFSCDSFIKICKTQEFSEICLQGPEHGINCLTVDSSLQILALSDRSVKARFFVVDYPECKLISAFQNATEGAFTSLCFSESKYLLGLQGPPYFLLILWNWRTGMKLSEIDNFTPLNQAFSCSLSVYPGCNKFACLRQSERFHFYEIDDICEEVQLRKRTVYLLLKDEKVGSKNLTDKDVWNLNIFDKMSPELWGIHSELLHKVPLNVICEKLHEANLINFNDYLNKKSRLTSTCYCWTANRDILVACTNGTILKILHANLSMETVHIFEVKDLNKDLITGMTLNSKYLYIIKGNDLFLISDLQEWNLVKRLSLNEPVICTKFSPNFQQLLFTMQSGSLLIHEAIEETNTDVCCLVSNMSSTLVVGIFVKDSTYCVTAKACGLIESWELSKGAPSSHINIDEALCCMKGSPSSSIVLIAARNTHLYIIDVSRTDNMKVIHVARPCETNMQIISCDIWGRYAILVSNDHKAFIFNILPSIGFYILGYYLFEHAVLDLTIFSDKREEKSTVLLLCERKDDKRGTSNYIVSFDLPDDLSMSYKNYWADESGIFSKTALNLKETDLEERYSSIVVHHKFGLYLYIPSSMAIQNIPFHFNLETDNMSTVTYNKVTDTSDQCQLVLSPNHKLILCAGQKGKICAWQIPDFQMCYMIDHPINDRSKNHIFNIEFSLDGTSYIYGGSNGLIVCCGFFPKSIELEQCLWLDYLRKKRKEENNILSKLSVQVRNILLAWDIEQINVLNADVYTNLRKQKEKLEDIFQNIQRKTESLVKENSLLPPEHQITSEEFIFDEELKEQLLAQRTEILANHQTVLDEKVAKNMKLVENIKEECINNMLVKGKILKPLRDGRRLYNYSIPKITIEEKKEIDHAFRTFSLQKCFRDISDETKILDIKEHLSFNETAENQNKEEIGSELLQEPFQLQSREERINYAFIIKYIILKKRLSFNKLFENLVELRKNTVNSIKSDNSRLKEILSMLQKEQELWDPEEFDESLSFSFGITDEEIQAACKLRSKQESEKPKGIADYFLKDEWLLKQKVTQKKKFQPKLKKEILGRLKKESDKLLKHVNELVENYNTAHENLVDDKLQMDLNINQDELQIFLLHFSVANNILFKKWEVKYQNYISSLRFQDAEYNPRIEALVNSITRSEKMVKSLEYEAVALDEEVEHLSKISRNKIAFLAAYKERPKMKINETTLDPYKQQGCLVSFDYAKMFEDLNRKKHRPPKVPPQAWKQLCIMRGKRAFLEQRAQTCWQEVKANISEKDRLGEMRKNLQSEIEQKEKELKSLHLKRLKCTYETAMVFSIKNSDLEMPYPDSLDFRQAMYIRKSHLEAINSMICNAGDVKLDILKKIAKTNFHLERNQARLRKMDLEIRDMMSDIETIKSIPLSKDVQKIIHDPKAFSPEAKIDALEKSAQMERNEIEKQIKHVNATAEGYCTG
ncbi:WD repeat-containing protein 96, partial [Stegodyphus mimosarum]